MRFFLKGIFPLLIFITLLVLFQNCGYAINNSLTNAEQPDDSIPNSEESIVSDPILLVDNQRTVLGQRYSDETISIQAGSELFIVREGNIQAVSAPPTNSYQQGSTHLTMSLDSGEMLAIDMSQVNGRFITFDDNATRWTGRYLKYNSPLVESGSLLEVLFEYRLEPLSSM